MLMSVLIWIQTVSYSDSVLERIFENVIFGKKSADDNKSMGNKPVCKELTVSLLLLVFTHRSK